MSSHTGESSPGPQVGPGHHHHEDSEDAQQLRADYDASQASYEATKRPQFFRVPRWPAIGFMLVVIGALIYWGGQSAGARAQSAANGLQIQQAEEAADEAVAQSALNEEIVSAGVLCILTQLDESPDDRLPFAEANGPCERFLTTTGTTAP